MATQREEAFFQWQRRGAGIEHYAGDEAVTQPIAECGEMPYLPVPEIGAGFHFDAGHSAGASTITSTSARFRSR